MRWTNENTWNAAVQRASERYGVPTALIKAIIGQESAFRPTAYRVEAAIQDASIGLMQILYSTARGMGYTGPVGDVSQLTGLYHPDTNIMFGTAFLDSQLNRSGGNIRDAISAYNGGWRPDLGFGRVAKTALTVCLMRDTTGKCIRTRAVPVGEYANQPYVNAVMANYQYFLDQEKMFKVSGTPPPIGGSGGTSPPLGDAHHDSEPEIGGHSRGTVAWLTWAQKGTAIMTRVLAVASGKKWVSLLGLLLTALGFLCLEHRADLDAILSPTWATRICSGVTLLGGIVASLGKGLADQRKLVRHNSYISSPEN